MHFFNIAALWDRRSSEKNSQHLPLLLQDLLWSLVRYVLPFRWLVATRSRKGSLTLDVKWMRQRRDSNLHKYNIMKLSVCHCSNQHPDRSSNTYYILQCCRRFGIYILRDHNRVNGAPRMERNKLLAIFLIYKKYKLIIAISRFLYLFLQ